jgi:hypothetical protein
MSGSAPDTLMRSKLRSDGNGGSLVRTSRASGDIELLRIVLKRNLGRKQICRSNIRRAKSRREQNAQKATKRLLCGL